MQLDEILDLLDDVSGNSSPAPVPAVDPDDELDVIVAQRQAQPTSAPLPAGERAPMLMDTYTGRVTLPEPLRGGDPLRGLHAELVVERSTCDGQ